MSATQQVMSRFVKTLAALLVMLALVVTGFANGFVHEASASCLPVTPKIAAEFVAGPHAALGVSLVNKEVRLAMEGRASNDASDKMQDKCCSNMCPSLFLNFESVSTGAPKPTDIRRAVIAESLRSAFRLGLERPPKLTRTI